MGNARVRRPGAILSDTHNGLLEAVDALTRDRIIHTTRLGDNDEWLGVHSEVHPPLLVMLRDGTGISRNGGSSDPGIPIDADALEIQAQIGDLIRLWSKKLGARYDGDDLLRSVQLWHVAHANAHRAGKFTGEVDRDVTRMVEGWVRMIEGKFDPPEKREWKEACPAWRLDGEVWIRCDAKRVNIRGNDRFAIELNITAWTAECVICGTKWSTTTALQDLRYESNVWEDEKVTAQSDTPEQKISA
jgi:hypothetical protein